MMATSPQEHGFTYQDYLTWPNDERWEIVGGIAYAMTPSPQNDHQEISMALSVIIGGALMGKECRLYAAPFDVILSDYDVVQPDLFVVCDSKKITKRGIVGAPDFVIEILSPSTHVRDLREKRFLYECHGVREYLVVDPERQIVYRYVMGDSGKYGVNDLFDAQDEIALVTLPGLVLPMWTVFGVEKTEKVRQTPGVREK
jgi:Uma2 family endonuclease